MGATLKFRVQTVGNYGHLALDDVGILGQMITRTAQSTAPGLPPPPLATPMTGREQAGLRHGLDPRNVRPADDPTAAHATAEQADVTPSRPWQGWFLNITDRLNAVTPSTVGQSSVSLMLEAPSVDETDVEWFAVLPAAVALTDPLIFAPTFSQFPSRYGRKFAPGDLLLIADAATHVDKAGVTQYNFEIAQLTAISDAGKWTVTRKAGVPGQAQFGTPLVGHAAGVRIYRMIDKFWSERLPSPQTPQFIPKPWASMCVAAVRGTISGIPPVLAYLIPPASGPNAGPPAPGFRTLNGYEYTIGKPGANATGDVSILRLSAACFSSFRNFFFEFDGAAGAGAGAAGNTLVTLVYISPDRKHAYQVAKFTIPPGSRQSFTMPQQNTRFPSGATWPPHAYLPEMTNALDANGVLKTGFGISTTSFASLQEDGELDCITTQAASTPGNGLRGSVQT